MLNEYRERAYAKVNFNLNVLKRRSDGFHGIESIFQTIDLFDELIVTSDKDVGCNIICDSMDLPENNTLSTAYQAFYECTGLEKLGVKICLNKGIPAGGGLGGGSADAAALIRVLEKIHGIRLTVQQIDFIAAKTGSDVFFFMYCDSEGKGAALVSGRGEYVKRIDSRQDLFLLLIFPGILSSTKEAYALVDEVLETECKVKCPVFGDLLSIYKDNPNRWTFKNSFTPSLCKKYDTIQKALEDLKNVKAEYVEMSGSGSTVFGVFTLWQQAIYSCNLLADTWNCVLVQTL